MELKEKDVYSARWKERSWGDQKDHCFEGLLVVVNTKRGLILADTYWGIGDTSGKTYNIEKALEKFDLVYYCNLDEIDQISEYERKYYDDEDIIYLHRQHACAGSCQYFYIKKGAKRSQKKMVDVLNEAIKSSKHTIKWETEKIRENTEKLNEVLTGNLDIYI